MRIGILPLCRATFDVELATAKFEAMKAVLYDCGYELVGGRGLLVDDQMASNALDEMESLEFEHLLLLQVTFTDASTISDAARRFRQPLAIWSVREGRTGGRLRLNSFCGLNLASHSLSLQGRPFSWLYMDPQSVTADMLSELFSKKRIAGKLAAGPIPRRTAGAESVASDICGKRIGRIGCHPAGFDTCMYDPDALKEVADIEVSEIGLDELFSMADRASPSELEQLRNRMAHSVRGLGEVNQIQLERSLRLKLALEQARAHRRLDAFAIRCWPEAFTEYGGAMCGPASLLGESRVPCACEADVYGAFSQLILQRVADSPVFLADLVDIDPDDDTGVVWHCGQAPMSMCDPDAVPEATVHSNRLMPLLYQFPLRPGKVTLMRVSQSFGHMKLVLAAGRILKRPMAFTGTSGVLKFERPAGDVLDDIIASGLEHHLVLTYGEHRKQLRDVAAGFGLPVLEL